MHVCSYSAEISIGRRDRDMLPVIMSDQEDPVGYVALPPKPALNFYAPAFTLSHRAFLED